MELGKEFEVASLKVAIANVKRRQGDYKRSKELAEEARKEYRKLILDYARCLNVLGLAHLRGFEEELEKGVKFCEESKWIKEKEGDKNGVAESENAIALLLIEQGRQLSKQNPQLAGKRFKEAIKHLEDAINIRVKFGFYRGCAQHRRNIGDAFRELMKIKEEKEDLLQKAEENYTDGIYFWSLIKPVAPTGEILHYNQRIAGLYADFVDLISEREQKEKYLLKIISIYKNEILNRPDMLQELKDNRRELENAKKILESAIEFCKKANLPLEIEEISKLIDKLVYKV